MGQYLVPCIALATTGLAMLELPHLQERCLQFQAWGHAGRQAHLVRKPASPDSSCAVSMPPRMRMMVSNTEAS